MSATPDWALSLIYWLHMLATIVWIGGLSGVVLLILPAARRALPQDQFPRLLDSVQRRLDPAGWLCLVILLGTGMFQMSANLNYAGFLEFNNRWAIAILVKHLFFIAMLGVSAYITWGLLPALRRASLRRGKSPQNEDPEALRRREVRLLQLNFVLGIIILGLTALARVS